MTTFDAVIILNVDNSIVSKEIWMASQLTFISIKDKENTILVRTFEKTNTFVRVK